MPNLSRWLPFLNWPRPDATLLRGELGAALTVAVVMVPQSVAYAGLAGMPLVTGLYATFLPALAAVLFSGSTRLIGGAVRADQRAGRRLAGRHGAARQRPMDHAGRVAGAAVRRHPAGLGAAGAAWVLNLVSSPVLAGFSQAAALLIIASQIPALLGLQGPLASCGAPHFDLTALGYGIASLLLFVLAKRFAPRVPIVLLVMAGAAALSQWTGYSAHGAVIGALAGGPAGPLLAGAAGVGLLGRAAGARRW